jgi:WD40 repeat protein/serine/threonine protein kinase
MDNLSAAEAIFFAALNKRSAEERAAYLEAACGPDLEMRRSVERLLNAQPMVGSFLQAAALGPAATVDEPLLTEGPGTRIGPYKLLQQIGEGGMGIVYMAEQQQPVRRKVALKIIKPGMDSAQVIARFEAERQALALMDHQNIAKVFDAGTTETGRPYFVMELVHGVPITQFCDANQFTPRERLALFVPVCQAIQHAHQKGIIHRDVKPSNILVTLYDDKPVPKVIDFGVAKAIEQRLTERTLFTQFGFLVGTFEYMSPEQAEMNALGVDTRSDIYSLGVLLYELLAGTTPLQRERLREAALDELVRRIKEEEPPRPSVRLSSSHNLPKIAAARKTEPAKLTKLVRGEIDWIVMKCLEKDRSRRYETTNSLARDVERYLHDEPVEACPPSASYRLRKSARKYRMPLIVGAAFALLLVAGVVISAWQAVRATDAEREATRKRQEAEAAREQARTAEADTHRLYYAASMGKVQTAWESHDTLQVRDLLAETAEFPERGWEWYFWQRLCALDHRKLVGHQGGVTAVAFSPDGQRFVTGGADSTARVWDATDGRQLFCLRGHGSQITAVAYAPDGKWLATGSTDSTARIWDATDGRELRAFRGQKTGPVWAVAVTSDGKRVVMGCEDGTARVWDAANGQEMLTFRKHTGPVYAVAGAPDGRRLLTGSQDRTARLWDADNGRELLPPLEHKNPVTTNEVTAVAFSANGQWLLTGYSQFGQVNLWDAGSGRVLHSFGQVVGGSIRSVALTPDGKRLASANGKVWATDSEREIVTLNGGSCIAVSPDGRRLATGSTDGTLRVWDTARLWDAISGQELLTLKVSTDPVVSVAVTPDGQRIATGGEDGKARLWDAVRGREILTLEGRAHRILSVALTPDGQRVVTGGWEGTVKLWDAVRGDQLREFAGHTGRVFCVAATPDGQRIISASEDGTARVWDTISGRQLLVLEGHTGAVNSIVVTPDGQRIITGTDGGRAQVWDAATGRQLSPIVQQHTGGVYSVALTPDGQRIVTSGLDGTARLWDLTTGRELLKLKGHTGPVFCVAVTPDGQRILTGGQDTTARLWDAVSGRELLKLKGHTRPVRCLAVTADGRLITGSGDGTVKIWVAASPDQVASWARQEQELAQQLDAWRRPVTGTPGSIQETNSR